MNRIGNQIPTSYLILPYETTEGPDAVALYNQTHNETMDWQGFLLNGILARNDDGLWVHAKFGYSVSRRNGKSEVVEMRELLGLKRGEKILHTAHRTTTSHSAWERICALLDALHFSYTATKQFGLETIKATDGGQINFRTRSSKGGLGEGYDLLVIDEAQEYTDDQETALKYIVTDSKNPQTIFLGTPPTTTSAGTVFTKYRRDTLAGANEDSGWAEWSVDERSDIRDIDLWYLTNPSLGIILTERAIRAEMGPDDIDFNIQRLGLWIKYNQHSAISKAEWESFKCESLPALQGKLFIGIKFGHDGNNVAMALAVKTTDGRIFIESIDCRPVRQGMDWIIAFLISADVQKVVIDGANGQAVLSDYIKDAKLKPPILPKVNEIIKAYAIFEQALVTQTICHMDQPSLTQVASNCEKRAIGSNGGFGYSSQKSEAEIALLDSVVLAHWVCTEGKEPKKQKISY